ncbi:hypothetical protein LUZ60_000740 [Juncus effusus]|nr:hypothetical protein LUZ60_000740 [Juncus effusus]
MMDYHKLFPYFLYLSFVFYSFTSIGLAQTGQNKLQNYIIIVDKTRDANSSTIKDVESWHLSLLSKVCKESATSRLIYSYNSAVNGFAARLTQQEVQSLSNHQWFVRAILDNKSYKLATTHTPQFLGLRGSNGVWNHSNMGEGIIIGVIDSGIYPDHPSFNDDGMPPPPAKWKGHCDFNASLCNNKLIGAKSFFKAGMEEKMHVPPFDVIGHGTHTASTAAGSFVKNAKFKGTSMGMASGVAPRAHLAIYRVCTEDSCTMIDTMKGIEEAVNDGVDVISLSIASSETVDLFEEATSIAGYYAMMKGVFVSCAAGNNGATPTLFSPTLLSNVAPWVLTVAASTMDRQINTSVVKLGNTLQLNGVSSYQPKNWKKQMLPLVYLGSNGSIEAGLCQNGTLDAKIVHGKVVVCDRGSNGRVEKGQNVLKAGGAGMILVNSKEYQYSITSDDHVLPASHLSFKDGETVKEYIQTTKNPTATFLFKGIATYIPWAPMIAEFSSRGPNAISPLLMKPDITGPGVDVLAAVPPNYEGGKNVQFEFMSGTSMSTPHLSGIAAIIKKAHPDWSPAAIKSAIMTTAYTKTLADRPIGDQKTRKPVTPYDMGAGHVDPIKALDPGLIYDLKPEDYIPYLCSLRYNNSMVSMIVHPAPPVDCARVKIVPQEQLNYPSLSFPLKANRKISIRRVVTNVGEKNAKYTSQLSLPKGLSAQVIPKTLQFTSLGQKKSYRVVIKWFGGPLKHMQDGELKWVSNKHIVRSPITLLKPLR